MLRRHYLLLGLLLFALVRAEIAHAGRTYTNVQSPAAGSEFAMGSTQMLTYQITNTATAPNNAERIYQVRFRISSGSLFSSTTAAPAGWTRTAFSTTSVTFQANSWANAIIVGGGSVGFTLAVVMRSTTADANETLRDIRSRFTSTTTGPPFTLLSSITTNTPGSWTIRSLSITSFQITDTSGVPITAQTAGNNFQLRMTVVNNSNTTQNPVASTANSPAATWIGTGASPTCAAGGSLSLAAGASGTIIFSCSSVAAASGTISFSARAQRAATVTSANAISTTLAISRFTASVATSASCLYSGASLTVTMTIANNTGGVITSVTGALTPIAAAPVTFVSGPAPASVASMANLTTANVVWVYTVNSAGVTNPFTFSGSATGTSGASLTTPTAVSAAVTRGDFAATVSPTSTNAGSTNVELAFDITNAGCAAVNSVAITAPAGWVYGNDAYSLVNLSAVNAVETWAASGVNPVTFTSPDVASQMPVAFDGAFSVVYSATPAAATSSVFVVRVTDATGAFADFNLTVTVNAFKSGTVNNATNRIWREEFK